MTSWSCKRLCYCVVNPSSFKNVLESIVVTVVMESMGSPEVGQAYGSCHYDVDL